MRERCFGALLQDITAIFRAGYACRLAHAVEELVEGVELGFGQRLLERDTESVKLVRELSGVNIALAVVVKCIDHHIIEPRNHYKICAYNRLICVIFFARFSDWSACIKNKAVLLSGLLFVVSFIAYLAFFSNFSIFFLCSKTAADVALEFVCFENVPNLRTEDRVLAAKSLADVLMYCTFAYSEFFCSRADSSFILENIASEDYGAVFRLNLHKNHLF